METMILQILALGALIYNALVCFWLVVMLIRWAVEDWRQTWREN